MLIVRLACFLIASGFLSLEAAYVPDSKIETIEGPWEMSTVRGIDGIFLTNAGPSTNIRVYHRQGRNEAWGFFGAEREGAKESNTDQKLSTTFFDGNHLRIHFADTGRLEPFDLDVTFSAASDSWSGTWSHGSKVLSATLKRPEPNPKVPLNPFVGDWVGEPSKFLSPASLHICQSSDGVVSAWLERDNHSSEYLYVYAADDVLRIYLPGDVGPASRFVGELTENGSVLEGKWTHRGGGAPDTAAKFRRASE